jgi:hypothetical protein
LQKTKSAYKNEFCFYTPAVNCSKRGIKKTIPFTAALKNKYLKIT